MARQHALKPQSCNAKDEPPVRRGKMQPLPRDAVTCQHPTALRHERRPVFNTMTAWAGISSPD
jgi:hypothetical protein